MGRVGRLELSQAVLGTSCYNVTGLAVLLGMSQAIETPAGQVMFLLNFCCQLSCERLVTSYVQVHCQTARNAVEISALTNRLQMGQRLQSYMMLLVTMIGCLKYQLKTTHMCAYASMCRHQP